MTLECYNCGQDGHMARECTADLAQLDTRPAAPQPGGSYSDHREVIDSYVRAWQQGEITLTQKRRAISDENLAYYGGACPRRLIWP